MPETLKDVLFDAKKGPLWLRVTLDGRARLDCWWNLYDKKKPGGHLVLNDKIPEVWDNNSENIEHVSDLVNEFAERGEPVEAMDGRYLRVAIRITGKTGDGYRYKIELLQGDDPRDANTIDMSEQEETERESDGLSENKFKFELRKTS